MVPSVYDIIIVSKTFYIATKALLISKEVLNLLGFPIELIKPFVSVHNREHKNSRYISSVPDTYSTSLFKGIVSSELVTNNLFSLI